MIPTIEIGETRAVGTGLRRPECALCFADGSLLVSQLGSGATLISPDGAQLVIGMTSEVEGEPWIPNGMAVVANGDILVANMGKTGGLWRLRRDGGLVAELRDVGGETLGATNFVLADAWGRVWITVTTRLWPISRAFTPSLADGYIVLLDRDGARIVADGLCFANELRIDRDGQYLYVAETFARRISRFRIMSQGSLGTRETFTTLSAGTFPDGLAFDVLGHLWLTSIISNRVIRVAPDGEPTLILEDNDPPALRLVEDRLARGELSREDVQNQSGSVLSNVSSIAFGGTDGRTCYLGSLGSDHLITFRSPVSGELPSHWNHQWH